MAKTLVIIGKTLGGWKKRNGTPSIVSRHQRRRIGCLDISQTA
jgi:hypothetical protein